MRRNLKNLRLRAIAAVDRPCQEHAKALVIKRAPNTVDESLADVAEVAKYICENDGAHSFQEVLTENKFDQNVWPCVDALSQSIRSIVGDGSLTGGGREAQIGASVSQFLSAVRDISPEVSKQLELLLIGKREQTMNLEQALTFIDTQKTEIGTLKSAKDELTTKLAAAEKATADATTDKEAADAECKKAREDLAKATDETVTVGGKEIKKSEVGSANFTTMKAIADERDTATLEKRAAEEFPHVVGTATEKGLVLKTVNSLPEDAPARKALETILTAAEKMAAAGFGELGYRGEETPTAKAAKATFAGKVSEIQTRDKVGKSVATSKARAEFPAEFAAAYPDNAAAAN